MKPETLNRFIEMAKMMESTYPAVPSHEELAALWQLNSAASASHHVSNFVKHGWLKREPHSKRSMYLTREGKAILDDYKERHGLSDIV